MPKITIIDYGLGNLRSVEKAVEKVGGVPQISSNPKDMEEADGIILPGVGAFRDAQANILRLKSSLLEQVNAGKPILGICLGLQLLFTESTEGGTYRGLDIIKGKVIRFQEGLKVPHMGWNTLHFIDGDCPLIENVHSKPYVYFVHSYYGAAENEEDIVAETDYGITFPSIVSKENVFATQFHPEKSGKTGLRIMSNFVGITRR